MRRRTVGTYLTSFMSVRIIMRPGLDAQWIAADDSGGHDTILLGADQEMPESVMDSILHETTELVYEKMGLRYDATSNAVFDYENLQFFMSHHQFTQATARVADLLFVCWGDVLAAWNKWQADRGKRK